MINQNNIDNDFSVEEILIESLKQKFNYLLHSIDATVYYGDEWHYIPINEGDCENRVLFISITPASPHFQPQIWEVDLEVIEMEATIFEVEIEFFLFNIIELLREHANLDVIGYYLEPKNFIRLYIAVGNTINPTAHFEIELMDWRKELSKSDPELKIFPSKKKQKKKAC